MSGAWEKLEERLRELEDLGHAIRLAHWDQEVGMPPKGGPARARALATLQGMAHARLIEPEVGELLQQLEDDDTLDLPRRASLRILRRDHDKAVKVPGELVLELAELEATSYQVWTRARPENDFAALEPHLTRLLHLKKEQADAVGWENERYDALLDDFEPDMRATDVESLFADLTNGLRRVSDEILGAAGEPPGFLNRHYDPVEQQRFCEWLVETLKFDMSGGRLDSSPHPFTMTVGAGDVRQTTRADPTAIMSSIYAAIHETGHALYEQNLPDELRPWPVGQVPSLGMHESQSRLWENHVGRGRSFTGFILPHLKKRFPSELADVSHEEFFRGVNHAHRTPIRVTADEVTYNLHVGLRFELELGLFRDEIEVKDLPEAWNEGMERWVQVRPANDSEGVLQDMHWSIGALGYFPTYTLGTLYAAAFYEKAGRDIPDLDDDLARGEPGSLLAWLKEHIHSQAYIYPAPELGERILGEPLSARPFIDHLRKKFGQLYNLTF